MVGPRSRGRKSSDQGLDRFLTVGRQLVDGVAGARPGSRPGGRSTDGSRPLAGRRGGGEGIGRWIEDRLEWLLEDDDWREPWQEPSPVPRPVSPREVPHPEVLRSEVPRAEQQRLGRRPLEAMSRRSAPLLPPQAQEWPDDASFSLSRWQRPAAAPSEPQPPDEPGSSGRPLPRSTRRRPA